MKQQEEHLAHQQSCRRLYGAWHEESKRNPSEILWIIHNKMDTTKTALLRMHFTTKATQGLAQLPMNVTRYSLTWARGWRLRILFSSLLAKRFQCHNIIVGEVVPSVGRPLHSGIWGTISVPASELPIQGVVERKV